MRPMKPSPRIRGPRRVGATLSDVVVLVVAMISVMAVLAPAFSALRAESLRARCGANLKRIGSGYRMFAGDNQNFWPPRCRANAGCNEYTVPIGFNGPRFITAMLPYYQSPNNGLGIVGQPTLKSGVYGDPNANYNKASSFSLNPWVLPNWRPGTRMRYTDCPADVDTLKSPDNDVQGFPQGTIASAFDLHGTSYATNIEPVLSWRGHGVWAGPVESAINRRVGPNYNPELIYQPNRYIVTADLAIFYWNWQALLANGIGEPSGVGAWHDPAPPPAVKPKPGEAAGWRYANALFGDLHVQYREYLVPFKGITLTQLGPFVNDEWSLYPYKRRPQDVANYP